MRSSTGAHYIALDHVRALAAFLVVVWHFTHGPGGYPVRFDYVPWLFPLALLDEGHTGVALFMTLSGYLFAKLLDGTAIHYPAFLWNRVLRLFPLLLLVLAIVGAQIVWIGGSAAWYAGVLLKGLVVPAWPNGAWSITVELHYCVVLPLLLWMLRRSTWWLFMVVAVAIALRWMLQHEGWNVRFLAYWTIVGRIDQFVLGMLAYRFRPFLARQHAIAATTAVAFMVFYWYFDSRGGFTRAPSGALWNVLGTIEGAAYAIGIAWYDGSFAPAATGVSKFVGRLGEYSYSIYLLHYFVVFAFARFVDERVMDISNFYLALAWATAFFVLMYVPGSLSFRFVEAPFLRLRRRYVVGPRSTETTTPGSVAEGAS
jgi:peptidoglycan/LPS O-acetylase OafA/YrhL